MIAPAYRQLGHVDPPAVGAADTNALLRVSEGAGQEPGWFGVRLFDNHVYCCGGCVGGIGAAHWPVLYPKAKHTGEILVRYWFYCQKQKLPVAQGHLAVGSPFCPRLGSLWGISKAVNRLILPTEVDRTRVCGCGDTEGGRLLRIRPCSTCPPSCPRRDPPLRLTLPLGEAGEVRRLGPPQALTLAYKISVVDLILS